MKPALLAFLALADSASAGPYDDHSGLVPTFECTWSATCTLHHRYSDATKDRTPDQPVSNQWSIGMTGLLSPWDVGSRGAVLTYDVPDAGNHFEEHWFIEGSFDWTESFLAEFEGPGAGALPANFLVDPYLYMDIRYKQVPNAGLTDPLTYVNPAEVERLTFDLLYTDGTEKPQLAATLLRERWIVGGDRFKDYWLFVDDSLVLEDIGDTAVLVLSSVQYPHPAAWFDANRATSSMYTRIKFQESVGSDY